MLAVKMTLCFSHLRIARGRRIARLKSRIKPAFQSSRRVGGDRCAHGGGPTRSGNVKRKSSRFSPGSKLGPAGKQQPPKVEKLKGDDLPPPEQTAGRKPRQR